MTEFTERVRKSILDCQLLSAGEPVLVAVSGGLDSMVLLHVLSRLAPGQQWRVCVAHFNHQLRAQDSDHDEEFVRKAASELGLPFERGSADVRQFASDNGLSIEMAARQLRHEFLARTARTLGPARIATGHHADDQLELFFLRLLRGAGVEGLVGMKPASPSPADPRLTLVRPLLECTRRELELAAGEEKISYRPDASNQNLEFDRNRIRHELLPLLRNSYQPALHKTVLRLIEILSAESDLLAEQTLTLAHARKLDFAALHPALQRRWLRAECRRLGLAADFDLIEGLRAEADREWMIEPELVLWRDRAGRVHTRRSSLAEFQWHESVIDLDRARGQAEFGGLCFTWHRTAWTGALSRRRLPGKRGQHPSSEWFDAERIGDRIRLRHWRPGDRFQPIGMKAPVKAQNLFVNCKIPQIKRRELTLAETLEGEIFWIEGLRISENFKITEETRKALEWRWTSACKRDT